MAQDKADGEDFHCSSSKDSSDSRTRDNDAGRGGPSSGSDDAAQNARRGQTETESSLYEEPRHVWARGGPGRDVERGSREAGLFGGFADFVRGLDVPALPAGVLRVYDTTDMYVSPVAHFGSPDRDDGALVRVDRDSHRVEIAYGLYQEVLDAQDDAQFHMLVLCALLQLLETNGTESDDVVAPLNRHPALVDHRGGRGLLAAIGRLADRKRREREIESALHEHIFTGGVSESSRRLLEEDLVHRTDTAALTNVTVGSAGVRLDERLKLLADVYDGFRELTETSLCIQGSLLYPLWTTYIPLSEWIVTRVQAKRRSGAEGAYVLGLTGPQGSGKSTLSAILSLLLKGQGCRTAGLSIDDIYRTYEEREALKAECPFYRFRGLPGTHDVDLGVQTIRELRHNGDGETVSIPVFDKSLRGGQGDRLAEKDWRTVEGAVDVVFFEGWCVGARPQSESSLKEPVDAIEASSSHDDDRGRFRRRVNDELRRYGPLFDECDDLVVLHVPNLSNVYRWRGLQEEKLKAATGTGMEPSMVQAFVDHFLPATARYVLPLGEDPTAGASVVLPIGDDRSFRAVRVFEAGKGRSGAEAQLTLRDEQAIAALFLHPNRAVRLDMGTAVVVTDGVGVAPMDSENPLLRCHTPNLTALASPLWSKALAPLWERSEAQRNWPDHRRPRAKASVLATSIHAASVELGLKRDQPGDSSVGHSSLGLGRYVRRYIGIIWDAIENGAFVKNEAIRKPIEHVLQSRERYPRPKLHIWGFCSRGFIHSDFDVLFEILELCARKGLGREEVVLHVVTDGKDVPKDTGGEFVKELEDMLAKLEVGVIGTICGRDGWIGNRDQRFMQERNGPAARCILEGKGVLPDAPNALAAIEQARRGPAGEKYGEDLDRFLPPTHIEGVASRVESGDAMLCFNLREDRSVLFPQGFIFPLVEEGRLQDFVYSTLIELRTLQKQLPCHLVAFRQREDGERAPVSLLRAGYRVRAFAESEKGNEVTSTYLGERREAIVNQLGASSSLLEADRSEYPSTPSRPDQEPEMRAAQVSELIRNAMGPGAAVLGNLCNGDVIGHYGDQEVSRRAMSVVDDQIGRIVDEAQEKEVILLITADHGCVETWGPMHSANLVPFQVVFPERYRAMAEELVIGHGVKTLADVEPTRFTLSGVPQPAHMTGDSILIPDVSFWPDARVAREIVAESAKNNFALLRRCPDRERIARIVASILENRERQVVRMFLLRLEKRLRELLDGQCPYVAEFIQVLPPALLEEFGLGDEIEYAVAGSSGEGSADQAVLEFRRRLGGALTIVRSTAGKTHLLFRLDALGDLSSAKARALGAEVAERTECDVFVDGARPDRMDQALALAAALGADYFIVRPTAIARWRSATVSWVNYVEPLQEGCRDRGMRLLLECGEHLGDRDSGQTSLWRQLIAQGNVGLVLNLDDAMEAGYASDEDRRSGLRRFLRDPVLLSHLEAVRACTACGWFKRITRYCQEQGKDVATIIARRECVRAAARSRMIQAVR